MIFVSAACQLLVAIVMVVTALQIPLHSGACENVCCTNSHVCGRERVKSHSYVGGYWTLCE